MTGFCEIKLPFNQNAFWGNSHIPVFIHNLVKKTQMHGYDQAILCNRQRNVMGLALYRA
jgi:hypothetical protein